MQLASRCLYYCFCKEGSTRVPLFNYSSISEELGGKEVSAAWGQICRPRNQVEEAQRLQQQAVLERPCQILLAKLVRFDRPVKSVDAAYSVIL